MEIKRRRPKELHYIYTTKTQRMRVLPFFIACLIFLSCNESKTTQKEPFKSLLQNTNEVGIVFYNGGDTLNFQTTDSAGVRLLVESVTGNSEQVPQNCVPLGELRYKRSQQVLLTAPFSVSDSAAAQPCNYLTYRYEGENYGHRLTSKAVNVLQKIKAEAVKTDSL